MIQKKLFLKIFVTSLLLVACTCSSEKTTSKNAELLTEFMKAFEAGFDVATDRDYGRQPEKAIKVGAPEHYDPWIEGRRNRTYFLLSLRGPKGERVHYQRIGSCCPQPDPQGYKGHAMIDVFEVTYRNFQEPIELYFNIYSFDIPKIPQGFTFKKTTRRPWQRYMWDRRAITIMNLAKYTWWLGEQATSALLYWWPITLLASSFAIVVAAASLLRRCSNRRRAFWTLTPFVLPPIILLWGAIFEEAGLGPNFGLTWHVYGLYALVLCHIPLLGILIWWIKGFRWLAVGNSVLAAWLSCVAYFVSIMSVRGDWL